MGKARDDAGNIWETDAQGNPVRMIAPAQKGRVFSLPPNPKEVRSEARADEDQQMQRDNAVRAERAAERADKTANRQATAAERAANAAAKPTEYQAKSAGFLGRMMQAERDFAKVPAEDRGGRSVPRQAFHNIAPGIENTLVNTPERQMADQAVENFIAASLRQESGAAISSGEFTRQYKIFFPAPGDTPEVLAQKDAARRQAIEGFRVAAGPLADQIGAMQHADNEVPGLPQVSGLTPEQQAQDQTFLASNPSPQEYQRFLEGLLGVPVDPAKTAARLDAANKGYQYSGAVEPPPQGPPPEATIPATERPTEGYQQSILAQGLSGANEGLADVLGAPADLATAAINLVPKGINALANTNIPQIERPFLGNEQLKEIMERAGSIAPNANHPFIRRVGQSIGAAAVPLGGPATTLGRYGAQLLAGALGGVGGAMAQQTFPGNPLAEMAGEALGGLGAARGLAGASRRAAARQIEDAVPTIPQLREQAGDLYRAAESRGVVAGPAQTQQLSDDFRAALEAEGRISPTGRVSEVYPKAREAVQLIDDYAGHTMNPTQIQNVRGVVGDALASPERSERRLGSILTDVLDQWASPLAPELGEARDVASRYLTAEQLARARELAGARASQFTGSGFENALRTEYRGLDRAGIKGNARFNEDVTGAIENVARGTPTSNFFRGIGRLAPTGPVSGMGSIVPGLGIAAMGSPGVGAGVGGTLAGAGILGRGVATHMGINAADQAELIARNGGNLPDPVVSPELLESLRRMGLLETAKYLPE